MRRSQAQELAVQHFSPAGLHQASPQYCGPSFFASLCLNSEAKFPLRTHHLQVQKKSRVPVVAYRSSCRRYQSVDTRQQRREIALPPRKR